MNRLPLALLPLFVLASVSFGGPNAGGTLVVHDTLIQFSELPDLPNPPASPPPTSCAMVDNNVVRSLNPSALRVWKVYAAFPAQPAGSTPRLKGLTWGIVGVAWNSSFVVDAGLPDPPHCFEIVQGSWPTPSPGASIGQSFVNTQTSTMVECYWFGGYCYLDEGFATVPHASHLSEFVDDAVPGNLDPIEGFSTIGFGHDGNTVCPLPIGACCTGTTCTIRSQIRCESLGGTWRGALTSCSPNPCGPPTGACCDPDGGCTVTIQQQCDYLWEGPGIPCIPNPCPEPPFGACCAQNGTCTLTTHNGCVAPGVWQGPDSPCTPNPCPQPGACCFASGSCSMLTQTACGSAGGSYFGGPCTPNPCPQPPPTGACCFQSGSCSMLTQSACVSAGGSYFGGPCAPNPCPQPPPPTGACCFSDQSCSVMTSAACVAAGGTYHGGACEPNPCSSPPPGGYGDTVDNAIVIGAIPYAAAGTTTGYVNDYDEVCPYTGSLSPDVVYSYTPTAAQAVTIDLCASSYDTKVYVYQNDPDNLIACNDDFANCGVYASKIEHLALMPGNTFYIVIDGYGSASGNYALSLVTFAPPPPFECPAGALHENEPACQDGYIDDWNGGCGSPSIVFQAVDAQASGCAVMCGFSCTYIAPSGYSSRDTDWFASTALPGTVTETCVAEFPVQFILIYGADCNNLEYELGTGGAGVPVTLSWTFAAPTPMWTWVGPQGFSGVPNSQYKFEICGIEGGATPTETTSWGSIKARFLNRAARPQGPVGGPGWPAEPTTKPVMSSGSPAHPVPILFGTSRPPKPGATVGGGNQ